MEETNVKVEAQELLACNESFNYTFQDAFAFEELENRILFLNGDVDYNCVDTIVYQILRFNRMDKGVAIEDRKPIKLYINSPGGFESTGFGVVDAIMASQTPVFTINVGECDSAAFLIYIAGHVRYAFPHSRFLSHEGFVYSEESRSKSKDLIDFECGEIVEATKRLYSVLTNINEEVFDDKYRVEWYFLADKAKELGVVDQIIGIDCTMDDIL